jgi:hypothetical protein
LIEQNDINDAKTLIIQFLATSEMQSLMRATLIERENIAIRQQRTAYFEEQYCRYICRVTT